ncbi:unnamed protein product, partial [Brassica napus]
EPIKISRSLSPSSSLILQQSMALHRFSFSTLFLFSLTTTTLSLSLSTVYDLLPKYGLPSGLLPDSVTNFTLSDDGRFVVCLARSCEIEFDYRVRYEKTVSGRISYGSITELEGIQVKRLFIWLDVDEIKVDLPPTDSIYFKVGFINKKLGIDQFRTVHSCGGSGCSWKSFLQLPGMMNEAEMLITDRVLVSQLCTYTFPRKKIFLIFVLFGVMVGALFVVNSSVMDSCLCLDAHTRSKKKILGSARKLELGSSFAGSSIVFRLSSKRVPRIANRRSKRKLLIVSEDVAGNYDDTFGDVKTVRKIVFLRRVKMFMSLTFLVLQQLINYFTYKAVRTVLHQLYEMNPPRYTWFYNYVVSNRPTDGKRFLRKLGKENQELAERVMITRLHLYGKWIKKCDHGKIYQDISDENLALMRERLMETVIWPSDDSSSEVIG